MIHGDFLPGVSDSGQRNYSGTNVGCVISTESRLSPFRDQMTKHKLHKKLYNNGTEFTINRIDSPKLLGYVSIFVKRVEKSIFVTSDES